MNANDRRVKRTKRVLKEALAGLLMEKELQAITVKELVERADVSRGAFYKHYADIFDLYDQMANDLIGDIDQLLIENPAHEYDEIYRTLIDYIHANASIWRSFMSSSSGNQFRVKLFDFFRRRYEQIVLYEMEAGEMKEEWKYINRYLNAGFIQVLLFWIESDFSIPGETLLRIVKGIDEACDPLYE